MVKILASSQEISTFIPVLADLYAGRVTEIIENPVGVTAFFVGLRLALAPLLAHLPRGWKVPMDICLSSSRRKV